ncbi:MAG TPA: TolC family protein [Polyangiaceae bacterium]|nr:TolC family protein [Polyangiaceae bacterium]
MMLKNRSLPLFCLSAALLDAAVARAQAVPPAPGRDFPHAPVAQPPTAVAPPAPVRPNPPPLAPVVPPSAARPGAPSLTPPTPSPPGAPIAPGAQPSPPSGFTERELPPRTPNLDVIEVHSGGLTANEVARRALKVSPSVRAKIEQVKSANEKIEQTTISFLPHLTLQASYTRTSPLAINAGKFVGTSTNASTGPVDQATTFPIPFKFNYPDNNYALVARLSVPLSDYVLRISDASDATKASREGSRLDVLAERLKVASDARILYFNWLRGWAQVAIAENTLEGTRARLADARASFTVGNISKADLLSIEALVANTEDILNRSQSDLQLASGQLAIVMEDWHPNYLVGEDIPDPATIRDADQPLAELVHEAHTKRLEVHSIEQNIRALKYGASAARAGAWPHIDAVGDVTYANPNPRAFPPEPAWNATWSAGVQATWMYGDTLTGLSQGRDYDAQAEALVAQRRLLLAAIANEVLGAYQDLARARVSLDKQRVALAAAEEAYRVETDLFRAGRATGTELINSERQLLVAKVGEVNSRIDLTIASLALRHAVGRDVGEAGQVAKN